jgi:Zn-dependent peptidase ImmA (M78 family)
VAVLALDDQRRIDTVIDDVSQRLGVSYPENSLLEIAGRAGIRVIETDLHRINPTLSGAIFYDDPTSKTGPTIFIEESLTKSSKIFTLAHELAHHFLHEGEKLRLDDLDYSKDDKDTLEETQANYFAASLLIPKDLLIKKLQGGLDIAKLAEFFDASVPVIRSRLKWIKAS